MDTSLGGFYGLGIAPQLLETLETLKFTIPTPIQQKAIPIAIEGKDVIGIAQTGTGKTLAFGIPMLQRLAQQKGRGLILVPTRELAIQVNTALQPFTHALKMSSAVVIGGESMRAQISALSRNCRIIIATPGRLLDHIQQRHVRLDDVQVLILDEADRMLDMGFLPDIQRILKLIPKSRQTMLFSATMPTDIVNMAAAHMHLPLRTEIAASGTAAERISQEIFVVKKNLKDKLLVKLLTQYSGSILLFTRTKRGAKQVTQLLRAARHSAAEIHSNRSLGQRKEALEGFKTGRYRVLVATDIAARGIDVHGIELVINYDLPDDAENYVHRIGRTGRAGREGHAISLAMPEQASDVRSIERLIKTSITLSIHPEFPAERWQVGASTDFRQRRNGGGGGRRPPQRKQHRTTHRSW